MSAIKNIPWHVLIAVYLLASAVLSGIYYATHFSSGTDELFWYCNLALIILSYSLFKKNGLLLTMILISAIPTQFTWIAGDVQYIFSGEVLGRYRWFAHETGKLGIFFDLNYHFSILPAAAYGVYKFGYHRGGFKASTVFLVGLFLATRFFTNPSNNINCAFFPCDVVQNPAALEAYGWSYALFTMGNFILFSAGLHYLFLKILPNRSIIS